MSSYNCDRMLVIGLECGIELIHVNGFLGFSWGTSCRMRSWRFLRRWWTSGRITWASQTSARRSWSCMDPHANISLQVSGTSVIYYWDAHVQPCGFNYYYYYFMLVQYWVETCIFRHAPVHPWEWPAVLWSIPGESRPAPVELALPSQRFHRLCKTTTVMWHIVSTMFCNELLVYRSHKKKFWIRHDLLSNKTFPRLTFQISFYVCVVFVPMLFLQWQTWEALSYFLAVWDKWQRLV
jgi:hypothetical protein